MKTVLFSIKLKPKSLAKFKDFVKLTSDKKSSEWKEMLSRYDMSCVKIWHKKIDNNDYVFVYHEIGPEFEEKIKGWDSSEHPFDQWFNAQIMEVYDTSPIDSGANNLLELMV